MKKFYSLIFSLCAICGFVQAQPERPKLVVGIVVDQMRWDYLYRYQARYVDGGFKRLLNEGFSCENTQIPYIPSYTAIGHSSIYTGSVPSITGIAGNNFVINGKVTYCCEDNTVKPVGSNGEAGLMSPRNMWTTTIGDELRLATNNRSKVIGVSIKDRAAILPGGHHSNGSFWFDDECGKFITSTFYMDKLPEWVNKFNKQKQPDKLLSEKWNTLYPIDTYKESTADENEYENGIKKGEKAVLPLDLPTLKKKYGYDIIRNTPMGNTLTANFAIAAIDGENLGLNGETDMITVSFSCTDYVGHQVGVNAVETEDMYLRLDKTLSDFFSYLDNKVGKGNYLLFLTADHGGMNNAKYLQDQRIPAGSWSNRTSLKGLNELFQKKYNTTKDIAQYMFNYQIFFNKPVIDSLKLCYDEVKQVAVDYMKKDPDVLYACDMEKASISSIPDAVKGRIINGYNRERSGGVQFILKPAYYDHGLKGTTHGAWNPYDTHIPLVFMGWGIQHGASTKEYHMTDIAPTVCALLHIQAPDGCIGEPIF